MNALSLVNRILFEVIIRDALNAPPDDLPMEDVVASFSRTIAIGAVGAAIGAKITAGSFIGAYLGSSAAVFGAALLLPLNEFPEPELVTEQALMTIRVALDFF